MFKTGSNEEDWELFEKEQTITGEYYMLEQKNPLPSSQCTSEHVRSLDALNWVN